MSGKKNLALTGGVLISAIVGYYNLGSSMNNKLSVMLSGIVFLLWMGFFLCLIRDKSFSMESFCKMSLVLAVCFVSGILLSQSFIVLLLFWPFMGIAHYFSDGMDERLTILLLYFIPVLLSFVVVLKNIRCNSKS